MQFYTKVGCPVLESLLLGVLSKLFPRFWVDNLELKLSGDGRGAAFQVQVEAGKWGSLLRCDITVTGRLVVNEQFELILSGLSASTPGLRGLLGRIGGLFVDLEQKVQTRLNAHEGRRIPLEPWFPGLQIRDVTISCDSSALEVAAQFTD